MTTQPTTTPRFSDAAIEWVFSQLHRWQIDPNDAEMQGVMRRFYRLGRHGGRGR